MLTRSLIDPSLYFLACMGLLSSLMAWRAVTAPNSYRRFRSDEDLIVLAPVGVAGLMATLLGARFVDMIPTMILFLLTILPVRQFARRLNMPGVLLLTTEALSVLVGTVWGFCFIMEMGLPRPIEILALGAAGFSSLFFACGFAERIARNAVVTHAAWRQPTGAPPVFDADGRFTSNLASVRDLRVSIHLPCYAEPPEVVKETMDRLAALDHDNYEVLVCDNNTKDEALWRPLEAYCQHLNQRAGVERFRFFHVSPLPGAKAGALNFCLEVMDKSAEIVAVVDADYLAEPDFLSRLLPFFADARLGYVQTPHDYREYEGSAYLTGCYWEYMPVNKVDMPGVSEYGGAFTIGTMCLLRTEALRKAGGWAEWCLTEDSEVSVRLRAVGYSGLYLGETFGRGLIPETFADYKKQRFRWTAGPVQQLRRHWKLFLPAPFAAPLPGWTKLLEVLRCIAPLHVLSGIVAGLLGFLSVAFSLSTGAMAPIELPPVTWIFAILGSLTWLVTTMHRYNLTGTTRFSDMVAGEVARNSLTYTVLQAGLAGLSKKPLAWRRTPKFALSGAQETVLSSSLPETVIGTVLVAAAIAALICAGQLGGGFAALSALTLLSLAARFFCAPLMAWLALRHAEAIAHGAQPMPVEHGAVASALAG